MTLQILLFLCVMLAFMQFLYYLKWKLTPRLPLAVVLPVYIAVNAAAYLTDCFFIKNLLLGALLSVFTVTGAAFFLFQGVIAKKVKALAFVLAEATVAFALAAALYLFISGSGLRPLSFSLPASFAVLIFFNILYVFIGAFPVFIKMKFASRLRREVLFVLIGLPFVQLVLLIAVFYRYFGSMKNSVLLFAALGMLASVLIDFTIIKVLLFQRESMEKTHEREFIKILHEMDLKYYELAVEESQKSKKLKHDVLNYIQTIYALFLSENEKNRDIAVEMVESLRSRVSAIGGQSYCENSIVSVVLALKTSKANELGIRTGIHVCLPEEAGIDKMDLCSVFVNLYDNAIEACSRNGTIRSIEIDAGVRNDYPV